MSHRLADDHSALDEVLKQLQRALDAGDIEASHAKLDLFWARLAVHIRAEHLHLFPSVINALSKTKVDQTGTPTQSVGQISVNRLRGDHEFFMRELAQAIEILHDLLNETDRRVVDEGTRRVHRILLAMEKRLLIHNEIEEKQIYRWATIVLDEQQQLELAMRVNAELVNRPARFDLTTWSNK
ncbi:MAG TPA: hypothetical protein VIV66_11545 [Pyrinomonadaceae bacterium]